MQIPDDQFELEPCFTDARGIVTEAGQEVFVRGIRNRFLGIGRFAGQLVLTDSSGVKVPIPIVEVQSQLLSGGQVDLWSTDPALIDKHRSQSTYPIGIYLTELAETDREISKAYAATMGIQLD